MIEQTKKQAFFEAFKYISVLYYMTSHFDKKMIHEMHNLSCIIPKLQEEASDEIYSSIYQMRQKDRKKFLMSELKRMAEKKYLPLVRIYIMMSDIPHRNEIFSHYINTCIEYLRNWIAYIINLAEDFDISIALDYELLILKTCHDVLPFDIPIKQGWTKYHLQDDIFITALELVQTNTTVPQLLKMHNLKETSTLPENEKQNEILHTIDIHPFEDFSDCFKTPGLWEKILRLEKMRCYFDDAGFLLQRPLNEKTKSVVVASLLYFLYEKKYLKAITPA